MKGRDNKMEKKKLSVSTGLCYAGGDVGCNIVFGMIGTLLTLFYTDYVGISAATVGLVMLLSRCFDGFSDLVMGVIVERTNSKWGKIKTLASVDEHSICAVSSTAFHSAAYNRDASVSVSLCNL